MCGIAGILGPTDAEPSDDDLKLLASEMSHRGPDASGVWQGAGVGLAHTRLSLFDLSDAANQPWVDGDDALVFNGEIYNFRDLRSELKARGCSFRSQSDTEVLFELIRTDGIERALSRVRGMFAFAYHEGATGITYLCRDRYGIKPLLYTSFEGRIVFASEVKALKAVVPVRVDRLLALMALRTLGDKFQARTLFRDVVQVAPGHVVSVRVGRVVDDVAYAPLLDQVDPARYRHLDSVSFEEVCAEFSCLFDASVDRMAQCDARLGVFLSGGVDSGLVSAVAVRNGRGDLRAFSSDVIGAGSERDQASWTAESLDIPVEFSEFGPEAWVSDWVRATWQLETPVITNPSAVPFARVAALAHEHGYKAVLTGEGADELFLGYPRLASGSLERIAGAPITAARSLYRRVPGLVDAILNERDINSYDFLRGVAGGFEDIRIEDEALDRYGFVDPKTARIQAVSAVMMQTSLQALLQRNDRMGMSASIESRFPFLDEELVGFALNLPTRWKLRRAFRIHDPKHPFVVDKAPVRATADRRLGAAIASRRKSGFPTPGLQSVKVKQGAFRDSWSSQKFGANSDFEKQISNWHQSYDVAKLLAVEIFGRLFDANHSITEVERFVHEVVA